MCVCGHQISIKCPILAVNDMPSDGQNVSCMNQINKNKFNIRKINK